MGHILYLLHIGTTPPRRNKATELEVENLQTQTVVIVTKVIVTVVTIIIETVVIVTIVEVNLLITYFCESRIKTETMSGGDH